MGRVVACDVVDHVVPHDGDQALMWDQRNWQSACTWHHSVVKQRLETLYRRGRIKKDDLRLDGWRAQEIGRIAQNQEDGDNSDLFWPRVDPSSVPLTIVCGPPGAGKSTLVAARALSSDVIIDLDDIIAELFPSDPRTRQWDKRRAGLLERNRRLQALSTPTVGNAWFVTGAPKPSDRMMWAERLKPKGVVVVATVADICIDRIRADPVRSSGAEEQIAAVTRWWADYAPAACDSYVVN